MAVTSVRHRTRSKGATSSSLTGSSPAASTPELPTALLELKIVVRTIGSLVPSARNARTHSERQIDKIAASLRTFGFVSPILIDTAGEIIAGHGRLEAARQIGMAEVPTICLDHMSEAEKRAYRIADNKLAELAGWDEDLLRIELVDLAEFDIDLPEITGFETAEIEIIVDGAHSAKGPKTDPLDELPASPDGPPVSIPGDQWDLGDHAIRCGDARNPEDYKALLQGELAQLIFTDPPYNVAVNGHVGGLGRTKHREFAMASGEMSKAEFTGFLRAVFACMAEASQDGSIHFTCIDWAHLHEMLEAGQAVYDELKNIVVWTKTNGGMGSLYRSAHELIPVWKHGKAPHINNIQLGKYGRYRTNSWSYAGVNTFRKGRRRSCRRTRPSSLVRWSWTPSKTARSRVASCSIRSVAAAQL